MRRDLLLTCLWLAASCLLQPSCDDGAATEPDAGLDAEADADADAEAEQGPTCTRDSDCELGRICAGGECVEGCASSRDCPGGLNCNPDLGAHGRCVACVVDEDCDGQSCINGVCVSACTVDSDCPPLRPLCDTRQPSGICVACLSVDDCPLLTLCLDGACEEGCQSVRDCPAGWFCDPGRGDHGQCLLDLEPEPEQAADADLAADLFEPDEPDEVTPEPEAQAEPDDRVDLTDDPPMQCDEGYNLSRGRGSLEADVDGRGSDDRYRSTDVVFSWTDSSADRPMLIVDAKEWCKYGTLKADLTISCLIRQEDLGGLPLEINLTTVFISGKNSCKAAYSDRRAVFRPMAAGSIVFEGYTVRSALCGRFSAEVVEATDPSNVLIFENGSFDAISGQ